MLIRKKETASTAEADGTVINFAGVVIFQSIAQTEMLTWLKFIPSEAWMYLLNLIAIHPIDIELKANCVNLLLAESLAIRIHHLDTANIWKLMENHESIQ